MSVAVITFPGSNCDRDCVHAMTAAVGAEATRSMRQASPDADFMRAAVQDRSDEAGPKDEIVGASVRGLFGQAEIEARLIRPAEVYPIFENALSARTGASPRCSRATHDPSRVFQMLT